MRTVAAVLAGALVLAASAAARAEVRTEVVAYADGDVTLEGYMAYDDFYQGKRPGVLVVHEWMGHNPYARMRAERLARLGYVAFALDMYGKAVHSFTNPDSGNDNSKGVAYNERADRRSWKAMSAFFSETLK